MSKLNCAKAVRNLASLYRDMEEAAKVLEELGSIEQAEAEATARLTAIRLEIDTAASELKQTQLAVEDNRKTVKEKLVAVSAEAASHLASAEARAKATLDEADKQSAKKREVVEAECREMRDAAAANLLELDAKAEVAQSQVSELEAQISRRAEQLDNLNVELERARDQLRKLIG